MTATIAAATSGSRPELIEATYRRLRRMDFDGPEAANLTALSNGFAICPRPWTVSELTHVLFLRESHRAGRWSEADDRLDLGDRTRVPVVSEPAPVVEARAIVSTVPSWGAHHVEADGRVTLLTLFRAMSGPNSTRDLLRSPGWPRLQAEGDPDGRDG